MSYGRSVVSDNPFGEGCYLCLGYGL